jgi:thiol-disulfide isomerase/thioredoxin
MSATVATLNQTTRSADDLDARAARLSSPKSERGNESELARRGSSWPLAVLLLVAAATLLVIQARRPKPTGPLVGMSLPPLAVSGWLNTPTPLSANDLVGKVVLIDFWSSDCGPCVRALPDLAEFYRRYGDQGLTLVGLTPESNAFGRLQRFVDDVDGVSWPVGYGAGFSFDAAGIKYTPTYVLFDRTGRSVWAGNSLEGVEDAVVAALAK